MPTLPKEERLRGDAIGRLFERGARGATKTVIALVLPPDSADEGNAGGEGIAVRVAFIAGKKLGCSVLRNRMRRRLRAAYRERKDALALVLPHGCCLVLMAKKVLLEARWQDVLDDVMAAATRAMAPAAAVQAGGGSCGRLPRGQSS